MAATNANPAATSNDANMLGCFCGDTDLPPGGPPGGHLLHLLIIWTIDQRGSGEQIQERSNGSLPVFFYISVESKLCCMTLVKAPVRSDSDEGESVNGATSLVRQCDANNSRIKYLTGCDDRSQSGTGSRLLHLN